ncbi:MAG: VanZ family protein [Clostridia bacterium]|nr:VanZ family protein [Clostridia bacterium]
MGLLIPAYLLVNWAFTLFTRTQGEYPVVFVPFRAYMKALGWDIRTFSSLMQLLRGEAEASSGLNLEPLVGVAQNIVLFLPFGFLMSGAYEHMDAGKILAFGFLLTLFIEVSQLVFRLGWFEVDDMIHNVFGTYAGICLFRRTIGKASPS